MLLATVAFACMHAAVRHVSADIHPFEVAFFRNLMGFLVIAPLFLRYGFTPLRTGRFGTHVIRALINVVAMLMFFAGLATTPLAQVQALGFTAPLFATLLAIAFLGERVGARRWTALAVGFFGALIILRPGYQSINLGPLLVVGSAAIWAVALIIIKQLSRTDSSVTITAYMTLLMTPLSLVPALWVWQTPDLHQFLWLTVIGVLGTLAQLLMTQSLRLADASVVLPLDFTKLLWGTAIGYLAFNEIPDIWTWVGGAIIFTGVTYITVREGRIRSQKAKARKTTG